MVNYRYKDVDISKYIEDQKKNTDYRKYKEKINDIYTRYKNNKSDKDLFDMLLIKFYEYCDRYDKYIEWKDTYLKIGKGDDAETISLIDILIDKIQISINTYKEGIGDFFSYTLMLITREIDNKTKDEHPLPVNKTDYKIIMQAAKKLKIDVHNHKINFEDIQLLAQETEFSIDKVKDILQKIFVNTIYSTDYPIQNDKDEEKTFGNTIEDEKSKLNLYEIEMFRNQLSLIDELYKYYRYRAKKQDRYINNLKPILANYIIKKIIQNTDKNEIDKYTKKENINNEYLSKESIIYLIKTFKFYDETDINIKQILDYFYTTGKAKTQKELAKMLNVTGESYINRIQNDDLEDILNKAIKLSDISVKTNEEIIEEVAKKTKKLSKK